MQTLGHRGSMNSAIAYVYTALQIAKHLMTVVLFNKPDKNDNISFMTDNYRSDISFDIFTINST